MSVYKELTESGLYTLPFLLHIYDSQLDLYLINDTQDLTYGGHTYSAAAFEYTPNANGAAKLETSFCNSPELANMVNRSRVFNCELIGVYKAGEIVELSTYKHQYGEATWDGEKFLINLDADDRGSMTFPALIYNSYNNRGA